MHHILELLKQYQFLVILIIMMINKITFVPNKPFGKILEIALTHFITLETFNSQFQINEVWFTDQKSQPLEVEDRINLTLVIKYRNHYKNEIFN